MNEETVTITKREYERLTSDSDILQCLKACGVDNWSGYCDAMQMYFGDDEEDEF